MERDLDKDLELTKLATPGPWRDEYNDGDWGASVESEETGIRVATTEQLELGIQFRRDAAFIAEAREALPYWLGEVKRLREALEATERVMDFMVMPKGYYDDTWSAEKEDRYLAAINRRLEAKKELGKQNG